MNEAPTDHLFDFSNMPLTPEQQTVGLLEEIALTLKRIEVLLTNPPQVVPQLPLMPTTGNVKALVNKARGK